jgi:hypothetical protein
MFCSFNLPVRLCLYNPIPDLPPQNPSQSVPGNRLPSDEKFAKETANYANSLKPDVVKPTDLRQ